MLMVKCFIECTGTFKSRMDVLFVEIRADSPNPQRDAQRKVAEMLADIMDPDIEFSIDTAAPFRIGD